jgi:ElaB protein
MNRDKEQRTSLEDDLTMLTNTLEEVLRFSGKMADDSYQEIKYRAEKTLQEVQSRLNGCNECYIKRAKALACCTNDYVREKPWCSVGIGATVGLIVGLLVARR